MLYSAPHPPSPARRRVLRSLKVLGGVLGVGIVVALVLFALRDNLVFAYSPSDLLDKGIAPGQPVRLAGMVVEGSLKRYTREEVRFTVTDGAHTMEVFYHGVLPDLFREKQGMIAEGILQTPRLFRAHLILAKHDERYMPKEVADALKRGGASLP